MGLGNMAPMRQPELRASLAVGVGALLALGGVGAAAAVCAVVQYWMVAVYCVQVGLILFFCSAIVGRLIARGGQCPQIPPTDTLTVIITGANTGIGKATAAALVNAGAHVVLACRSEEKGRAAIASICHESAKDSTAETERLLADQGRPPVSSRLEFMPLDLSSFQSIRRFADEWGSRPLHILINNAGVMMCPYGTTKEGHEMQFGTNHLGHFLLTLKLLPALRYAAQSGSWKPRVVCLASLGHMLAPTPLQWENVSDPATYSKTGNYGYSKLANVLFAREFQRRYGDTINAYSLHPGAVQTELIRHMSGLLTWPTGLLRKIVFKTPREGSQTTLFCATSDRAVPGQYHADCQLGPKSAAAADDEEARCLWELSLDLVQEP